MSTDRDILKQVLLGLNSTEKLCRDILTGREGDIKRLAILETKLDNLDSSVSQLLNVIQGTNGEGLQVKTKLLEARLKSVEEELELRKKQQNFREGQNINGKWGMLIGITGGLMGLISSIVMWILQS